MTHEHKSGLPDAFDRTPATGAWQGVVFSGNALVQGAELNEMQSAARGRQERIARLVGRDGDRVEGAAAVVDREQASVILTPGRIFVAGDVLPVALATLYDVPMAGTVEIGVILATDYLTHEDDPTLLGLVPGSLAEGEPGAARELAAIRWSLGTAPLEDHESFILVYTLEDGTVVDQTPPPSLSGINQAIALYDRQAHGNYIVEGCQVTALGKSGAAQNFSIREGIANIYGFKRTRLASLRHAEPETWDTAEVSAESHVFVGTEANVFAVSRGPIDQVLPVLVTKQRTVSITRGPVGNGADLMPDNSIQAILSVTQGGTNYTNPSSWLKTGDSVDWSPAGPEPAPGSSYNVTYRYLVSVAADSFTDDTITVAGGVDGTAVLLAYRYKLPRIDRLCLDANGGAVYLKGVSAQALDKAMPPLVPGDLLGLAQIRNTWRGKPAVENDGIFNFTYAQIDRLARTLDNHARLIQLERIKAAIDAREPVAKRGTFVDPLIDDTYRDQGVPQTAAVHDGTIQLAIDPTFYMSTLSGPVMLDWAEEVIVRQELDTFCEKINPYQSFEPMPAALALSPAADFWTVSQTEWTSPVTQEFNRGVRFDNGPLVQSSSANRVVAAREEQAQFLRPIQVAFTIQGFGHGEILDALTFDGISVLPPEPLAGNAEGRIEGSFTIPSNVPVGIKTVMANGAGGAQASAFFTGEGIIDITVMQRVTTVQRWQRGIVVDTGGEFYDPQAQTFMPIEARQLVGIDIKICHVGDDNNAILIHQVTVENGIPTTDITAEAFLPMQGQAAGWKAARYGLPVLTLPDRDSAFVVKTDDAEHSIAMARLGDFDAELQRYVGAQPYSIGENLSSSNARTWLPHPERDITFRLVAARYTATTKTVPLGSFELVDASDLQVRAAVELPSAACSVLFEIVRGNGQVWRLQPFQVLQLGEYITETVQLRAVLTGTEKLSPVLFAPVMLIAGKIRQSGTYVSRAFRLGEAARLSTYFKARLPSGSAATVEHDLADGNWQPLPLVATEVLADPGWTEPNHAQNGINAIEGRIRITLTGAPAARPVLGDLGAAVM